MEQLELWLLALEPDGLGVCAVCASGFDVPIRWELLEGGRWRIGLCCNTCGHSRDVVRGDYLAQRFAEAVTASSAEIEGSLRCPEPERMNSWVAAFSDALARDLVEPDDFNDAIR